MTVAHSKVTALASAVILLSLLVAGVHSQQPMCGQSSSPSTVNLGRPLQGFALTATPLRVVTNPRFQIDFPSPDFFSDNAATRGLRVAISGCFDGVDPTAQISNVTVRTRPGLFTGLIKVDTPCTVTVSSTNPSSFPNDLKAPSEYFGNFLTPNNNYFTAFTLSILSDQGVITNQGVNIDGRTANLQIIDAFNNIQFSASTSAGATVSAPGAADSIVIRAMPTVTVDSTTAAGNKNLQIQFNENVFASGASYTYSISGCATIASTAATFDTVQRIKVNAGTTLQGLQECVITLTAATAGAFTVPASNSWIVELTLIDTTVFALPRLYGRSSPVVTNAVSNFALSFNPPSPTLRTQLTSLALTGTLPAGVASGSAQNAHVTLRNIIFRQPNTTALSPSDLALDVSGCATASGLSLTGSLLIAYAELTTASPITISAPSTACTFTLRVNAGAALTMNIYEAATTVSAIVALSPSTSFGSSGALAYGQVQVPFYSMTALSAKPSSSVTGASLSEIVVTGTPSNSMLATENAELRLFVPKTLALENTKNYTLEVAGCANFGPKDITLPDDPSCQAVFILPISSGISAGVQCKVSLRPATAENGGGKLRNPDVAGNVVIDLRTYKNGDVVDFGNTADATYAVKPTDVNPSGQSSAMGASASVGVAVLALAAVHAMLA